MEEEWRTQAQHFGQLFTNCYEAHNTTTYIHIFVYHLSYYLEKYHRVKKFANYALKCKHCTNKIQMCSGTSGFSSGPVEAVKQQLNAQKRMEHHNVGQQEQSKQGRKRGWAEMNLSAHPTMAKFVISSTHI